MAGNHALYCLALFNDLVECLISRGFWVNRLEVTFPGKQVVLVCEILTKTSNSQKIGPFFLKKSLEEFSAVLKPYVGGRQVVFRFTALDMLFQETTISKLYKKLEETIKGKKLGKGLDFLISDVVRAICLITLMPTSGLFSLTFLQLIKKAPNIRAVLNWLDIIFRMVWSTSEKFRRVQGVRVQVKGR